MIAEQKPLEQQVIEVVVNTPDDTAVLWWGTVIVPIGLAVFAWWRNKKNDR